MQTVHIICGSTGAGKTTYARDLCVQESAQIFSIDEWMQNLFWPDTPRDEVLAWALERVRRCEQQISVTAERLLTSGISVILDLGFSKRAQREKFRDWANGLGHTPRLHFLNIPQEIRRERVRRRNAERSETFQFEVTDATFDWMEGWFEAPADDELQDAVVLHNSKVSLHSR